jgi:hypothetical protein
VDDHGRPAVNAKAVTNGLAEWLQALERDQIVETGRWDSARLGVHPVTTAMAAAGVMIASSVTGPPPGMMFGYATEILSRPAGDPTTSAQPSRWRSRCLS